VVDRPDKEANRAVYDCQRAGERHRFRIEPSKIHTSELLVPWIVSHIRPGDRVLDIAGGAGAYASQIVRTIDVDIVGLDISESMIQQRASDPLLATNIVGDMESLPFEPESFDAAMFVACLHHVPDPGPALREALRVLRPGGRMFAFEPSSLRAGQTGSSPIPGSPHEHRMSGRRLAQQASLAGFNLEEQRTARIVIRLLRPIVGSPSLGLMRLGDAVDQAISRLPGVAWLGEIAMVRARKPQ
jgi:SAM-dependent methyltransferase